MMNVTPDAVPPPPSLWFGTMFPDDDGTNSSGPFSPTRTGMPPTTGPPAACGPCSRPVGSKWTVTRPAAALTAFVNDCTPRSALSSPGVDTSVFFDGGILLRVPM
jgi:hypothetical protein